MKINGINHLAIAVAELDPQIAYYRDILGLELVNREEVLDQGVEVAMFQVGPETTIELLCPLSPESPVGRYLQKRGPGIHHLAFGVDDLHQTLRELQEGGVELVDSVPRDGAHGAKIAFAKPKSTFGVLTEFCQPKGK